MLRIVSSLAFAFVFTLAFGADYSRCAQRLALSMEKVGNSTAVALNERELLYFGAEPPRGFEIIKSDRFMGLYLLKAKKKMIPLELRELTDEVAESMIGVGTTSGFTLGKVVSRMNGFLEYAKFSVPTPPNSVITSICYQFYGLGAGQGFIETPYIKRFLEGKNFRYGDLGALFVQGANGRILVDYVEPFVEGIGLQMGDEILSIEGKTPLSFNEFLQGIYELSPGGEVGLRVMRNGKEEEIITRVFDRRGGMLLPYDYLSALQIQFSPEWVIEQMGETPPGFEKLQVGDQILKLNNKPMPLDFVEGAKLISSQSQGQMVFLVVRNGFQVFVTMNQRGGGGGGISSGRNDGGSGALQFGGLLSEQ